MLHYYHRVTDADYEVMSKTYDTKLFHASFVSNSKQI